MSRDRAPHERRFPLVSRRAFLRRSAVVGASAAALPLLAACGGAPVPGASTATDGPQSETAAAHTPAASAASPTAASAATGLTALPAGGNLVIDFTYQAAGGGRVHSPYIAVWIEDPSGDLVQTVSLWFKSDEGKYLRDLTRWNAKNNRTALTTGATRIPGVFAVQWDGRNIDGVDVAAGDYFACIEATREDGPYQIIRESVAINHELQPTDLQPDGELTAASISVVV